MPFQLGYVSTPTRPMLREDLLSLLSTARRINQEHGVTGLLLFDGGSFLQVLEGSQDAVQEIFGHIAEDERHRDVDVLFEEHVADPEFEHWSMGFQAIDGVDWLEFPESDGQLKGLRETIAHYGQAKDLLLKMRRRGLDPARDLVTSA